mmetsp:Transcript_21136/g.68381  ORF Transcript_21136/g.68381 Transcript_21136/m.68381 type:complete len:375 (+) Transcript_21136:286-1410(+)
MDDVSTHTFECGASLAQIIISHIFSITFAHTRDYNTSFAERARESSRVVAFLEGLLREVNGACERRALVDRLLVLALGDAVGDDAGARLEVARPLPARPRVGVRVERVVVLVRDDHGPERERHVEAPEEGDDADAAAEGPAPVRFQIVDDLHRAHLGRAAHRPRGQRRAERIPHIEAGFERARDGGGDVHNVRVSFHLHELLHFDRAALGDGADVVAAEVDEHDVLGALLLVREKLHLDALVLFRAGPARARAGERAVRHLPLLDPAQNLGRGCHEHAPTRLQIEHVRARIDHAESAVNLERIRESSTLEAMREHELENVPGPNVLFGPLHRIEKLILAHVGFRDRCIAAAEREIHQPRGERRPLCRLHPSHER